MYREIHRFGPGGAPTVAKNGHRIRALRANSLRIRTGNFLPPCRELNRVTRKIFALIRETRSRPLFWHLPCQQIRSSRQISNIAEKANKDAPAQMLDVAEADFELRGPASMCARNMMQIARRAH